MTLKPAAAAALLLVLSAGLARAQVTDSLPGYGLNYNDSARFGLLSGYERTRTPEELVRSQQIEQDYRATMRNKIPDRRVSNDPWRNIRQAPTPAAVDRHRPE